MAESPPRCVPLYEGAQDFNGEAMASSPALERVEIGSEYSVSFWVSLERVPRDRSAALLVNGHSQDEQQPGIYIQSSRLMIRFLIELTGAETLISSSPLSSKVWTFISLSLSTQDDYVEASLYQNGRLDSQMTVKGSLGVVRNSVFIGKTPWTGGISGVIAEPIVYPAVSVPGEVWAHIFEFSLLRYKESGRFYTEEAYANATEPHPYASDEPPLIEGHTTNTSGFLSVSASSSPNKRAKIEAFLDANEWARTLVDGLLQNYDWLMPIFLALRETHPAIQENKLELDRMLPPLIQAKIAISRDDLQTLSKLTRAIEPIEYSEKQPSWCDKPTDELIAFPEMFARLREAATGETIDETATVSRFDKLAEIFLETRSAEIEVCVDHCVNCGAHQTTTWHEERQYSILFNSTLKRITDELPSATVIGNKYGPPSLGVFSVSIEGVGSSKKWDSKNRLVLVKKHQPGNYYREVMDAIYLLAYCYGDFAKVSREQVEYKRNSPMKLTHPECHAEALPISDISSTKLLKRKKSGEKEYDPDTVMYCLNWACVSKQYTYGKNSRKLCRHHPGRWEFGSVHGLWPENWTCCRRKWEEEGCTLGMHRGVPYSQMARLCINHGEVNPRTDCVDSICGKSFLDPATLGKKFAGEATTCKYHSGFKQYQTSSRQVWTCCSAEALEANDASSCEETEHRYAEWPEEEAKIYFVTKEISLSVGRKGGGFPLFSRSAGSSRFFCSKIKPYVDPLQRKQKSQALLMETSYCLNWGCERTFKEAENSPKACKCHTSYYDFGHSGSQVSSNKETQRIVLWEAHWRCCGGAWESPGCTFRPHQGPLLATMPQRKWKWPAESAKRYFIKKISSIWQKKLDKEHITKAHISKKYDSVCSEARAPKLPSSYLFRLCMALHLHILCVSPDMSYMFKYQDVVSGRAEQELCGRDGCIDKDAFEKWWFAPLEQVRPQMAS